MESRVNRVYSLDGKAPELGEGVWVAPNAVVVGEVRLGPQSSVWFGATIRGDNGPIVVGARTNVQDGAVLHSDAGSPLTLGDDVTVGHQAMLHGCTVGSNCLVGIGATVLNGAVVEPNCLIGAHSLVPEGKRIPAGSLVMGIGKVVRQLSPNERTMLGLNAEVYVDNSRRFAAELQPVDLPGPANAKL
jgi:Carbonic anhydrases/acetyltransferases, isoleucine patch superfamily